MFPSVALALISLPALVGTVPATATHVQQDTVRRMPSVVSESLVADVRLTPQLQERVSPVVFSQVQRVASVGAAHTTLYSGSTNQLVTDVDLQSEQMVLRRGDYLRLDSPSGQPQGALLSAAIVFPTRYVGVDESGEEVVYLRPVVDTAGSRLRLDPARPGVLTARFLVGLEDSLAPLERKNLARPVRVQVSGGADAFAPSAFNITHTNLDFVTVGVELQPPDYPDTVRVRLRTTVSPEGFDFSIPVGVPEIPVSGPDEVAGLGLAEAVYIVHPPPGLGPETWNVTVSASRGSPEPRVLTISEGSVGEFSVRADGLRPVVLTVTGPPLSEAQITLDPRFPWGLLIAALLGGFVGGLVRSIVRNRRAAAKDEPPPDRNKWESASAGIPIGFFAAVAYSIGVNLGPLPLPNTGGEALYFTLAGLAAAFGPSGWLGRVRGMIGSHSEGAPATDPPSDV